VLPLPGHRVALPTHEVAQTYHDTLAEHGLSLGAFAHKVQQLALPGSYRRLLAHPLDFAWEVVRYADRTLPLTGTDLTALRGAPPPAGEPDGPLTALVLRFTLPPSTYATMLLRELTKQPSELAHQMLLNERAADADAVTPAPDDAATAPAAPLFADIAPEQSET
jgi:tRNA pseudouridine13 synthase